MTTLPVSNTQDFSADSLSNIDGIDFQHPTNAAVATFANTQFNNSAILNNVQLDGSNPINAIVVNGGSINASLWTFANWSSFDTITLNGSAVGDAITGSSQDDTITGGLGADTLVGGNGDDTFVYNAVAELAAGETIAGGGGTGDALRIAGAGSYDFRTITAPGGIERLEFDVSSGGSTARFNSSQFGGAGISDTLAITGDGNPDIIILDTLSDAFFSAAGWTFTNWTAGDDVVRIFGTSAAETITGSSQANVIDGGGGADILRGGDSDDTFFFGAASDIVAGESVDGKGGTDRIFLSGPGASYDLSGVPLTSIEKVEFGGTVTLTGGQIGPGAITLDAGTNGGVQAVIVNGALVDVSAVTFASWTVGQDTVTINGTAGNDSLTGSNQRDTLNGGGNQDALNGGAEADTLNGEAGNDTLNGGVGLDALNGGLGNDTYVLGAENGDTITDTGGVDTVTSTIDRTISGFGSVENLTLLGSATTGTGNGLANTILGNALGNILNGAGGADTLDGGAAADTMRGGADSDTYIVENAGDVVDESVAGSSGTDTVRASVSYSLAGKALGSVEKLVLTGTAANATGNGLANTITGNASANTIDGKGGADTMRGLGGSDTYVVDNANDVVDEFAAASGGTDIVQASVSYSLAGKALGSVEKLVLTGTAANATGNGLANTITGNASANTIDGKGGADTMRGLGGSDTYIVDNVNDVVDESAAGSGGADTVEASVSYSLAANALGFVEDLTLTGAAASGTGNSFGNAITGSSSANTLDGQAGDDRLIGGLGADQLNGGGGIDTFAFLALADSGKKKSARDTILDFGVDDFIDLSAIDAKEGGTDNKFKFIKKQDFHKKKGELHFEKKKGDVIVSGDVNGDGKPDFAILLDSLNKVAKADFIL